MIGALNWGLVGVGGFMGGNWNLIAILFGAVPQVGWTIYVLVGLAALYELVTHKSGCNVCDEPPPMM
jgi:uncharacterized membrane protein YuzA (DUF378 family)